MFKFFLPAFLVVLVIVGAFLYFKTDIFSSSGGGEHVIIRTDDGYSPNNLTIKKGDTVTWKNQSSKDHWPASNIHPTHGLYPEFDPLGPVSPGEDWSFTFEKVGQWKFHDHLQANMTGVINVGE